MKNVILLVFAILPGVAFAIGSKAPKEPLDETPKVCVELVCEGDDVTYLTGSYKPPFSVEGKVVSLQPNEGTATVRTLEGQVTKRISELYSAAPKCLDLGVTYCVGKSYPLNDTNYRGEFYESAKVIGAAMHSTYNYSNSSNEKYPALLVEAGLFSPKLFLISAKSSHQLFGNIEGRDCAGAGDKRVCVGDSVSGQYYDRGYQNVSGSVLGVSLTGHVYLKPQERSLVFGYVSVKVLQSHKSTQEEIEARALIAEGKADEAIYRRLRNEGMNHSDALEQSVGPSFHRVETFDRFLVRLAENSYQFDRKHFEALAEIFRETQKSDLRQQLETTFLAATLPLLRNSGYTSVKERFLDRSVKEIESTLARRNVRALRDIEPTRATRKLALQMLAASLSTSAQLQSPEQKMRASKYLAVIGAAAASEGRGQDLAPLLAERAGLEALIRELGENRYLLGRMAADMALLEFLGNW